MQNPSPLAPRPLPFDSGPLPLPMESALADLLAELSAIQTELLAVLTDKRHRLLTSDIAAMDALREREQELIARLQACQERRLALLAQAATEGLPANSLRTL